MSFDYDSYKKKKNDKENDKKTKELEEDNPQKVRVKKTITSHQMRRVTSELNLEESLPWHFEVGCSYHCLSMGDVDSLTYLRVVVKQQHLKYVALSTWCMARTDIEEMANWLEKGYIDRIDFYVGEIYTSRYAEEWHWLKNLCRKYNARARLFKNHAKIMACFGDRFDCVIESSANVNTNPRCENTCITVDSDLAYWYKDFYDNIKSFDRTFDNWKPYNLGGEDSG